MTLRNIGSYNEMKSSLNEDSRNYVLLFKKGSEKSECSYKNIEHVLDGGVDINVVAADVTQVKDIHTEYGVTSAPTLLVFQGSKFEKTVKGCNDSNYYKSLFESALFSAKAVNTENPQKRVTVYSTPTCTWCTTLKTHLKKNNIRFTDIDVSKDQKAAEAMTKRSGQQGVPQTDIGGVMIVGFDKNKINSLLGI